MSKIGLHLLLFVATCVTTTWLRGPVFAATLLGILLVHEMGHYLVARQRGIDVSLPYFVPVPFSIGTMGAVIRMRSPIQSRDALIDVGAAGPLAGLAVAIPLLLVGLAQSPIGPIQPGTFMEGNSLLYLLAKWVVKGSVLPIHGVDVMLSPMAEAAWVGLLVTFINLIPIGQLDGGHIAAAFFGDRHERTARILHFLLGLIGLVVAANLYGEARNAGRPFLSAVSYGVLGALPWGVWFALVWILRRTSGGRYHPSVGDVPLSPGRRRLFWVMAVLFLWLFTPVPIREALP
jgi:uncharacterized protein (TIGR03382 family)